MVMASPAWNSPLQQSLVRFDDIELLPLTAALTLGLCTFFGFTEAPFAIISQLALIFVLFRPAYLSRVELWLVLAFTATGVLIYDWSVFDNHKYLLVYWLWVMTFAAYAAPMGLAEKVLTTHARFFLIFVFLAAACQKIMSPSYMSGEMFEIRLLFDRRFAAFGNLIGIGQDVHSAVRLEMASLKSVLSVYPDNSRVISSTDWVRTVAVAITWYDLVIQLAIGLLFLPARKVTDAVGHALLLFFIYTTYLPAPVFGFGWQLTIWGLTLALVGNGNKTMLPKFYFGAFAAILIYQLPWREWVITS